MNQLPSPEHSGTLFVGPLRAGVLVVGVSWRLSMVKRRGILVAGGGATVALGAAALGWPGWLRKAFAGGSASKAGEITPETGPEGTPCPAGAKKQPSPEVTEPKTQRSAADILKGAQAQALNERKKLLVFVIPQGKEAPTAYERGRAFGEYLNHGSSEALAPLSSAVVVCVRMEDLESFYGHAPPGQPLLVLVDPRPATLRPFDAGLPQPAGGRPARGSEADDKTIDDRIAVVAGLVRQALGSPPAAQVGARADLVRQDLVQTRPPGAQWANSSGCGSDFEEGPIPNDQGVDCGMGFVPKRSARFLVFLTNKP